MINRPAPSDYTPEEQRLAGAFASTRAPRAVDEWRSRPPRRFRGGPEWARPLAAVLAVAVVGGGLGGYLGFRAATGGPAGNGAGPQARMAAAMAYDEANGTVVLFGGALGDKVLGDTWTWDGSGWTEQHPSTSPPARGGALMAYDPNSHDVVLLGGYSATAAGQSGCVSSSGSVGSGVVSPAAGGTGAPSPDASVGSVPVSHPGGGGAQPASAATPFAGAPIGTVPGTVTCPPLPAALGDGLQRDTWLWDGSNWHKAGGAQPAYTFGLSEMVTDPARGAVLLVSATPAVPVLGAPCPMQNPDTTPALGICDGRASAPTYTANIWDGTGWRQAPPPPTQGISDTSIAMSSLLVSNPVSGHVDFFREQLPIPVNCGSLPTVRPLLTPPASDTLAPPSVVIPCKQSPSAQGCCSGIISQWNGTAWAVGGFFDNAPFLQREVAVAVGDLATHSILYYGPGGGAWGGSGSSPLSGGSTWVWTGTWTQLHPGTHPAVLGAAAAYDAKTGQVVMFGGGTFSATAGLAVTDQTWTWNGSNWTQRTGGHSVPLPTPPVPSFVPGICPTLPKGTASSVPVCPEPAQSGALTLLPAPTSH